MATGYPLAFRVNPKYQFFALDPDAESKVWRARLNFKAFAAASLTGNNQITFPGNLIIERCFLSLITVFSGGGTGSATLAIGTTGTPAAYLAATNVFTGATAAGNVTVGAGAGLGGTVSAATTPTTPNIIQFQLVTTTQNTNTLTQGVADVFLVLRALSFKTA